MEANSKQQKIIYSKKIVDQLLELGFKPIDIMPNPIKPDFYCWAFEPSEELRQALDALFEGAKRNG